MRRTEQASPAHLSKPHSPQRQTASNAAKALKRRPRRRPEDDVAPRPITRRKTSRKRKGMTLARRSRRLPLGLRCRLPTGCGRLPGLLLLPIPPAPALLSPRGLPSLGRPVAQLLTPAAPRPSRLRADCTAVPLKMMGSEKPPAAPFQEAPPRAAGTTGAANSTLTIVSFAASLGWAHGRSLLPVGSSPGAGAADSAPGRFFCRRLSAYGLTTITLPLYTTIPPARAPRPSLRHGQVPRSTTLPKPRRRDDLP